MVSSYEDTGDERFPNPDMFVLELTDTKVEHPNRREIPRRPASGDVLVRTVFPPGLVQNLSMSEPFAVSVSPGLQGGLVIEENGNVQGKTISLTGVFGKFQVNASRSQNLDTVFGIGRDTRVSKQLYQPRHTNSNLSAMHSQLTTVSSQSYMEIVQDRIFRRYAAERRMGHHKTRMVFRDLKADEHYVVVPLDFSIHRATRQLSTFHIQLLAVDHVERLYATQSSGPQSWYSDLYSRLRSFQAFGDSLIADVVARYQAVTKAVQAVRAIISTIGAIAEKFVRAIEALGNVIRTIESAIAELVTLPQRLATQFLDAVTGVVQAAVSLGTGQFILSEIEASNRELQRSAENLVLAARLAPQRISDSVSVFQQSGQVEARTPTRGSSLRLPTDRVSSTLATLPGDTIFSFAERAIAQGATGTVAEVALAIIEENKLVPPYLSDLGLPGTQAPGRLLRVPSLPTRGAATVNAGVLPVDPGRPTAERLYGRDLRLYPAVGGKLDILIEDGGNIPTWWGPDCFEHSIKTRLLLTEGGSKLFPALGLPVGVGRPLTASAIQLLRLDVRTELLADPWVIDLPTAAVQVNGDRAEVSVEVQGLVSVDASVAIT